MSGATQVIALLLFTFGLMALLAAHRLRGNIRPPGHVDVDVDIDVDGDYVGRQPEAYIPHGPLVCPARRLAGQTSGLLRLATGRQMIPIYVCEQPAPDVPADADQMRVAALCLLTEVIYDQNVPYGLLRYTDRDIPLAWTADQARVLDHLLRAMQSAALAEDVPRSHNDPATCGACPVRGACEQALA
jgi:hypothetical protein